MDIIDNVSNTLKNDLARELKGDSLVSIAASCFSMYAFKELKKQLEDISELRFMFTSPVFLSEKSKPEQAEFRGQRLNREKSLGGSEFEAKLHSELTRQAIAKECADWIKKTVKFRSNATGEHMDGFIVVENAGSSVSYNPLQNFTTVELGCGKGNDAYTMITKAESPHSQRFLQVFNKIWKDAKKTKDVTDEVISGISALFRENPPELIYYVTLYNIFREFLEEVSRDELPNDKTGFKDSLIWNKLYSFQREAALAIIQKLEQYNGCILADSVGLGKTFTALAVIKYYENLNKSVLVLCPKKLQNNWNTFNSNNINNPVYKDRLRYNVLFHTDLSRETGFSGAIDLGAYNWGNNDLVVIDESHNFRNGGAIGIKADHENRYDRLLNRIIKAGVKTKVLMLSATPVNNRFFDLNNQLKFAYEGEPEKMNEKLNLKNERGIDYIFRQAQNAFNIWSKKEPGEKTTESLLRMLDFDFFELLDSVTIARSRKHIEKYYNANESGMFPNRNKPVSCRPSLTTLEGAVDYNEIYEQLEQLKLSVYTPSCYILPEKISKYFEDTELAKRLTQIGREIGIQHLMNVNLLKRLESSVRSFALTLSRIIALVNATLSKIDEYEESKGRNEIELAAAELAEEDFDQDDENTGLFIVGRKFKISLKDMDYISWRADIIEDLHILDLLVSKVSLITPEYDNKLQALFSIIKNKVENPINDGNKKIIIFSAFADTVEYLYENISVHAGSNYGFNTAMITGSATITTIQKFKSDFNTVLSHFSPLSKTNEIDDPNIRKEALARLLQNPIEILIGTDCISEGQNLQDCDYCINYDIHWNPVRIIQRFGRIDRIGSKNASIQLVNFWPDIDLDAYINLKERVEDRMKAAILAAAGTLDDNPIDEEKGDLEYRRAQLKRLQEEVVDIEDMQTGISIMDLGLSEFRLDIQKYIRDNPSIKTSPHGLHAIVQSTENLPPGAVFVLKYSNEKKIIDRQNRLHPYYMAYISDNGEIIFDYMSSRDLLAGMRHLCQNKTEPDMNLCRLYNAETKGGTEMSKYVNLLREAMQSVKRTKEKNDVKDLFRRKPVPEPEFQTNAIDDFEIVSFLVVKGNQDV
jgi:SNF2 family DNA or RNA helicase